MEEYKLFIRSEELLMQAPLDNIQRHELTLFIFLYFYFSKHQPRESATHILSSELTPVEDRGIARFKNIGAYKKDASLNILIDAFDKKLSYNLQLMSGTIKDRWFAIWKDFFLREQLPSQWTIYKRHHFFKVYDDYLLRQFDKSPMTPAKLAELMVGVVKNKKATSIVDPFAGTGALLSEAVTNMRNIKTADGATVTPFLQLLTIVRLMLTEQLTKSVIQTSLQNFVRQSEKKKYDLIMTNPPFGRTTFSFETEFTNLKKAEEIYLRWTLDHLKNDGCAAVVMPLNFLSILEEDAINLRRQLILEHLLELIVFLPMKTFRQTRVKTALLVINREKRKKNNLLLINAAVSEDGITENLQADVLRRIHDYRDGGAAISHGDYLQVDYETVIENQFILDFAAYASLVQVEYQKSEDLNKECNDLENRWKHILKKIKEATNELNRTVSKHNERG
jgi:type I restriction-modification system DNA methylase subunit